MIKLLISIIYVLYQLKYTTSINFISVGDLGGISLGGKYFINANKTISSIKSNVEEYNSKFIINTGDNFYYCGIKSTNDVAINKYYINIFNNIGIDWYNTLGNNDYGYNVNAQLELNKTILNWILPSRYYNRRIITNKTVINLVILNTSPCISEYINRTNNIFKCQFYDNIIMENCTKQYEWLNELLIHINKREWIIIVGHHPVTRIKIYEFIKLIDDYADLYINGHMHILNRYIYNGNSKYITTGAGSMVISNNNLNRKIPNIKWSMKVTGYTRHIIKRNKLITIFYDTKGQILYKFTVIK